MSDVLTVIERRIYNYLVDYLKRETYQPSIREIGTRFGIRSTKTVTEHLQSLQRKGYLDRTPSRSRALRILGLNLSPETYTIPLYRNGAYETTDEEVEARFDLDRSFACSADCFMVRASRASDELGVLGGDYVLVEPCENVANSDVAVYESGGAIELRRLTAAPGSGASDNGASGSRFLGIARAVLRTLPKG
jgi:repressor LexA